MSDQRFQGTHQGCGPDVKEQAEKKAKEKEKQALAPVQTQSNGMMIGRSLDEELRIANGLVASGMLPSSYKTAVQVVAARQFAFELGLKPVTALRQIAVINGTPSIFGDLPLGIVRGSGQLEYFKEYFIDKDGKVISLENKNISSPKFGAVCISRRKGMAEQRETVFTLDDAKAAGLYPSRNPDKPWAKYTSRMMQLRARNWNLKDEYGDYLNGVAIAEYDFNEMPDHYGPDKAKTVSPSEATSDINDLFNNDTKEEPKVEATKPVVEEAQLVEVVEAEKEDIAPHVFKAGFFAGEVISDVSLKDLSDYYKQLRQAKIAKAIDPELIEVLDEIEKHLEKIKNDTSKEK